jgi:VanZ family protein
MSVATLQRYARTGGWILAVLVVIASLLPGEWRQHTPFNGLVEHFIAYAIFAFVLELGYGARVPRGTFATLLVVAAAVLETAQIWVPGRHAAVFDFVASATGALAGIGLAWIALMWAKRS